MVTRFSILILSITLVACDLAGTKPHPAVLADPGFPVVPSALPLPYTEVQAEDGTTDGLVSEASTWYHAAAAEASGRRFVTLAPGNSVSWSAPVRADLLTVRFSYPDSPDGTGQDGTLDVQVGGHTVGTLAVTSRYSWVYGNPAWGTRDVWNQGPDAGGPRHFWDEASLTLETAFEPGTTVTVTNPAAAPVQIDLVDFELRAPEVSRPRGSVVLASFSPAADGVSDDTAVVQAALDAAQGGTLYVGPGVYRVGSLAVGSASVQGAGMARTRFVGPRSRFTFSGARVRMADFAVWGETTIRDDLSDAHNAFAGTPGPGSVLERLWVEHKKCAFWVGVWNAVPATTGLRITACRFRDLMADAVNLCSGTTDTVVDNCQVRNSGDDGLAAWSPKDGGPPGGRNVFAHNLVQVPWVASGVSLYGAGPFLVEGNRVEDTVTTGSGVFVASAFSSWAFTGTTTIRNNTLVRTGAHESDWGGPTGAIRVLAAQADLTGATFLFEDNTIVDPLESAVSLQGPRSVGDLRLEGLDVRGAPWVADVRPGTRGSATFTSVTVHGEGSALWRNAAGSSFVLTHP